MYFAPVGVPRTVGIIQPFLLFFLIFLVRFLISKILVRTEKRQNLRENVLIYGAGSAGRSLAAYLRGNEKYKLIGFIDDDRNYHSRKLEGYSIYEPFSWRSFSKTQVDFVIVAVPSATEEQNDIFLMCC